MDMVWREQRQEPTASPAYHLLRNQIGEWLALTRTTLGLQSAWQRFGVTAW